MLDLIRMRRPLTWLPLAAVIAMPIGAAADSIDVPSSRDNTLIESPVGNSNGAGDGVFAGRVNVFGGGTIRRGLLAFDVSGIPAGATVDTVELTLTLAQTTFPGPLAATLHRVSADWGEAGSIGAGGQGIAAEPGDATWTQRLFGTALWSTPGGDFAASPSASLLTADVGPYVFSAPGMVADVQAWVAAPGTNFGWLLKGDESLTGTVKKYYSREGLTPPRLRVVFRPFGVGVEPRAGGTRVTFAPPFPAPAHGPVRLAYTLPRTAPVSLEILDAAGRLVRRLEGVQERDAGGHAAVWDARSASGARVPAGVYLARLVVDRETFVRRVPVLP